MTTLFVILIILASAVLGLIVLIQNPKGGGLAGSVGGFSNQLMGVKQTTDVLEKGTWIFGALIGVLCMVSVFFIPRTAASGSGRATDATNATVPVSTPAPANTNTVPMNTTPAPAPAPAPAGK
ncbi:MAG: preprotein translocase subunit SecG [Chitinophagales bacterium]|jgi:preprotein translocase subunit SecG|nr:preprotein translocase subunit SecG [Chitinophagales bacterium]